VGLRSLISNFELILWDTSSHLYIDYL